MLCHLVKKGDDGKVDVVKCVGSSLNAASTFDPTGLLTIASAFMKPSCNVPRIDPVK